MNENEFEFSGKVYVAEPMEDAYCMRCAFYELHEACISSICLASQRSDKTQMIYKEKQ